MRKKSSAKDLARYKKELDELLEGEVPAGSIEEAMQDLLVNVAKLGEEEHELLELRLLSTAFKELRYAFKVFKPYRHTPKAAVFGSARTPTSHANFKLAEDFGKKLAKKGWMIITGGASGIMEAAMIGAGAENSFGLNILLPFEQQANLTIRGNNKLMFFKYFFTRKLMFLKESQATVLFPGGFGTFDEGFESMTLVQTGKAKPRPLVVVDVPGSVYWRSFLDCIKTQMADEGLVSPPDLSLIRHFHDPDAAVREVTHFYSNYDSSRFLGDHYLIRVKRPIDDAQLKKLSVHFRDILKGGEFERLTDLSRDDIRDAALHRILFRFDRTGYSRLRELIDQLNALPGAPRSV